jgi:hypothetical protein
MKKTLNPLWLCVSVVNKKNKPRRHGDTKKKYIKKNLNPLWLCDSVVKMVFCLLLCPCGFVVKLISYLSRTHHSKKKPLPSWQRF